MSRLTRRSSKPTWEEKKMLKLINVTTMIGEHQVIHDVSLQIAKGDFVALLGGNGSLWLWIVLAVGTVGVGIAAWTIRRASRQAT